MTLHLPFAAPEWALLRRVPDSYVHCLRPGGPPPDVALARQQQEAYARALVEAGVRVEWLPPDESHPDSCFPEDAAIVHGDRVLLTRPGAPTRRGEVDAVALRLRDEPLAMERMATGQLDGGDVLRVGDTLFVGRSARTDEDGVKALGWFGLEVTGVPVTRGLHLRSSVSALGQRSVIADPLVDVSPFRARGIEVLLAPEPLGANVLALGDLLLVSASAPRTAEFLAGRAHVRTLCISEFHEGDAAFTCLSLRFPRAGTWCA